MSGGAICGGGLLRKQIHRCPTCECRTEFVVQYALYYPPIFMCCRCGDSFDGEDGMHPRPFARGWRKAAVVRYRRLWDRAKHGPPPGLHELDPERFADAPT